MRDVNTILHEMHQRSIFHEAPYFYMVDKQKAHKTVMLSWNYAAGYRKKIGIIPLLGIPPNYTYAKMLRSVTKCFLTAYENDYRDLNLAHPTFLTLHFMPMNQCQDRPRRINA